MVAIIDIDKTVEHVLEKEKGKPNPSVFILGVIDSTTLARIDDLATSYKMSSINPGDDAELVFNLNQARIEYVKAGLKDVKGLVDSNGNPVVFKIGMINSFQIDDLYELGDEIKKFNKFSKAEEKN